MIIIIYYYILYRSEQTRGKFEDEKSRIWTIWANELYENEKFCWFDKS